MTDDRGFGILVRSAVVAAVFYHPANISIDIFAKSFQDYGRLSSLSLVPRMERRISWDGSVMYNRVRSGNNYSPSRASSLCSRCRYHLRSHPSLDKGRI